MTFHDIEVMAAAAGELQAQCQLCGGRLRRTGSMSLHDLVDAMTQHLDGSHPPDEVTT